jgi:hypothetical protein
MIAVYQSDSVEGIAVPQNLEPVEEDETLIVSTTDAGDTNSRRGQGSEE